MARDRSEYPSTRPVVTDLGSNATAPIPAAMRAAVRSMSVDRAVVEVIPRLRDAGIPSILLKGASHARWLYDDPDERTYADCDLLVPPRDAEGAESVLAGVGFVRRGFESVVRDRPHYGFPLWRADNVSIDLHTTFLGINAPPDRVWATLEPRTQAMPLVGDQVPVLDPVARALVLVLHAAKDGGKREGRGSKAIRDLELAVDRIPVEDWRRTVELATDLDALEAFASGLRRIEPGELLADELELTDRMSPEVALRLQQPPPLAVGVDWMMHDATPTEGLRVAARKVFPPPAYLRAWSPLARRGRLGLALAYIGRPFWVAWKLIPAIRAARKARKVAR
jgi:hypothetical protein